MSNNNILKEKIRSLVTRHGGLRAAARQLCVSPSYLGRLRDGWYDKPAPEILNKLKLRRVVKYEHK